MNCAQLKPITIPHSVSALENCSSLKKVQLQNGLKENRISTFYFFIVSKQSIWEEWAQLVKMDF